MSTLGRLTLSTSIDHLFCAYFHLLCNFEEASIEDLGNMPKVLYNASCDPVTN